MLTDKYENFEKILRYWKSHTSSVFDTNNVTIAKKIPFLSEKKNRKKKLQRWVSAALKCTPMQWTERKRRRMRRCYRLWIKWYVVRLIVCWIVRGRGSTRVLTGRGILARNSTTPPLWGKDSARHAERRMHTQLIAIIFVYFVEVLWWIHPRSV